jgi:hypothetical protein
VALAQPIVLQRLPNGFYSGSANFRRRIKHLGWLGRQPTTNALKRKSATRRRDSRFRSRGFQACRERTVGIEIKRAFKTLEEEEQVDLNQKTKIGRNKVERFPLNPPREFSEK